MTMMRAALLSAAFAAALAVTGGANAQPGPVPFRASATSFTLAPNDVAVHMCPAGYLVSVRAMADVDNANVRVTFVSGGDHPANPAAWLDGVSGFKLSHAYNARVNVEMICGS